MPRVSLLGIPIDALTQEEAVQRLQELLSAKGQHHVLTPNSEMLVEACRNPRFREVLCRGSLNLPDSIGLVWMARWTGRHLPERVTGVDTIECLCKLLAEEHPVFLLGGLPGIAERAASVLHRKNPRLCIVGTYAGSPRAEDAHTIVQRINDARPHLLLVAFGAPQQDLWVAEHLKELPSVRVAMGVGGTFDFLAGRVKRTPSPLRAVGLEWLWRLLLQPWRLKRIWTAVVVFPLLVLRYGRECPIRAVSPHAPHTTPPRLS